MSPVLSVVMSRRFSAGLLRADCMIAASGMTVVPAGGAAGLEPPLAEARATWAATEVKVPGAVAGLLPVRTSISASAAVASRHTV